MAGQLGSPAVLGALPGFARHCLAAPALWGWSAIIGRRTPSSSVVAVSLTFLAFLPGQLHGRALRCSKRAMVLAGLGLCFMISALIGPLHHYETLLTGQSAFDAGLGACAELVGAGARSQGAA